MKVVKITPRGYCHGVVTAINKSIAAAKDETLPKPIHILGMIVHNRHIVLELEELGIKTIDSKNKTRLELLDEINHGTVIFTAHGVSPLVFDKAKQKGLHIIDASCTDVLSTHNLIREKVSNGYKVIYIGKKNHPEPEGAIDVAPKDVYLVSNKEDIDNLNITTDKIAITNQTTLSKWDVIELSEYIKKKYPTSIEFEEICNATQVRQEAVAKVEGVDLVLVVGDKRSNNTNKLVSIAKEKANVNAYRISDPSEIDIEWLKDIDVVGVTSGASTPTSITKETIKFLEQFDKNDPTTWNYELKNINILRK